MPEVDLSPEVEEPAVVEEPEVFDDGPDLSPPDDEPEAEPEKPKGPTIESLAEDLGWKPKDNFTGHDDDWVDAATYIRRSKDIQESMRTNLKESKRKMGQMDKVVQDLKIHTEAIRKAEVKDLKARVESAQRLRDEAIEEGDKDRVYQMDKELGDLRAEVEGHLSRTMREKEDIEPNIPPEHIELFDQWLGQNPWYKVDGKGSERDQKMTQYAESLSKLPEYRVLPYSEKLEQVTELVKKHFPENGQQPQGRKPAASRVEGGRPSGTSRTYSARDLTSEQRSVMRNFVEYGVKTEKEYIAELAKLGEIG